MSESFWRFGQIFSSGDFTCRFLCIWNFIEIGNISWYSLLIARKHLGIWIISKIARLKSHWLGFWNITILWWLISNGKSFTSQPSLFWATNIIRSGPIAFNAYPNSIKTLGLGMSLVPILVTGVISATNTSHLSILSFITSSILGMPGTFHVDWSNSIFSDLVSRRFEIAPCIADSIADRAEFTSDCQDKKSVYLDLLIVTKIQNSH